MDKSRRKTYTCVHCSKNGANYTGERYRVIDHIQKHHLALDQVPFYCTLCMFRCSTRDALEKHVVGYKRHTLIASTTGASVNERRYLVENNNPRVLTEGMDLKLVESADPGLSTPLPVNQPIVSSNSQQLINVQVTPEMLARLLGQPARPTEEYDPMFPEIGDYIPTPAKKRASDQLSTSQVSQTAACTPVSAFRPVALPSRTVTSTCAFTEPSSQPVKPGSSTLSTPLLDEKDCDPKELGAVLEDLTAQLLGPDPAMTMPLSPARLSPFKPERKEIGIQTEPAEPPRPEVPTLGALGEALTAFGDKVEAAFGRLTSMVESNARAVRVLDKSLVVMAGHMGSLAKSLDRAADEARRHYRRSEGENQPEKRQRVEDKENQAVKQCRPHSRR